MINHPNFFSESSYGNYLQVLYKINFIQPAGEHREHHQGELFDQKSLSYTRFQKRQNYRKGRYTQKKVKIKSQERKNVIFGICYLKLPKIVLFWVLF